MKFSFSLKILLLVIVLVIFNTVNSYSQKFETRSVVVKKINEKINLDGVLDEKVWDQANSADNFWQYFPSDSIKSFNKTEVKLLYNDTHIFIGGTANSKNPNFVVNSLKRDYSSRNNDNISIIFETFNDGQNGFLFGVNAYGVQREALVTDRGTGPGGFNLNWDIKWQAKHKRYDDRYVIEMAIPFSSLKYPEGIKKWGFQSYRYDLQSNENSAWNRLLQRQFPINIGYYGEIIFEEPLKKGKNPLYVIPYLNFLNAKGFNPLNKSNDFIVGTDIKLPIGTGLNLDITVNPDFSNIEVDDLITNLTRFEISLPEKRQFFIDNGDLFQSFGNTKNAIPFFSRRIGIAKDTLGNTIQNNIIGGVRLSGKLDENWRIGFLNIQNSEDIPNQITSNNNSMLALQRKVFGQSRVGAFIINKQSIKEYDFLQEQDRYNRVIGADYNLSSLNNKWRGRAYLHKSFKPDDSRGNFSTHTFMSYNTRNWKLLSFFTYIDEDFRSELGFVPRTGVIRNGYNAERNFYPKTGFITSHTIGLFNSYSFQQNLDFKKTDESFQINYDLSLKNQSRIEMEYSRRFVFLSNPFDPIRFENSIALPEQTGYEFGSWNLSYLSNYGKKFNFDSEINYGNFFNGQKFSVRGRLNYRIQPITNLTLQFDYNRIKLPYPYTTANLFLVRPKLDLTLSKKLFWATLIQYSNQLDSFGINSRIQWRFAPLSDLYLVYNDNYVTQDFGPVFRSINLKLTYWLSI